MGKQPITAAQLRNALDYDATTGIFCWASPTAACMKPGDLAGSSHPNGYIFIKINGTSYAAHRLAWLYVHGRWPASCIDHRNGVRDDNRMANLRECADGQNNQNVALYKNNKSGFPGVGWHKATGRWRARIDLGGRQRHLGLFDSAEEAHAAYLEEKARIHTFQPVPRYA